MRRRSLRGTVVALLVGSLASVAPMHGATAQTLPVPELPPELTGALEPILTSVNGLLASLAPLASFDLDEEGTLFSGGAAVEVSGVYSCAKTIDLAPLAPHLTSQSITVDVAQASATVSRAKGRIDGFDITCDGTERDFAVSALVDGGQAPLRAGPVEVVARMSVCDLLGCTTAAAAATVAIAGDTSAASVGAGTGSDGSGESIPDE